MASPINLFVLSELSPPQNHVGWTVSHTLEQVLASCCDATFIYPERNLKFKIFNQYEYSDEHLPLLRRCRHRIFNSWYQVAEQPTLTEGTNILLVVGLTPQFLLSLHTMGPLLKQFDLCVAYLLDGFSLQEFDRTVLQLLDHIFVIMPEMADNISSLLGVSSTFLPLATDVLRLGSSRSSRPIDVLGYGRLNPTIHKHLLTHYGSPGCDRFYHYSTFTKPNICSLEEHVLLLSKMLSHSKISLCFEASHVPRFQGYSPILYRWFEGWAGGCTIVGKKPFGQGVSELMDWENSTYDVPENPTDLVPFFEELLQNQKLLRANTRRNYRESLLRHDWRYRIRDLFQTLHLPVPEKLQAGIAQLAEKAGNQDTKLSINHSQPVAQTARSARKVPINLSLNHPVS